MNSATGSLPDGRDVARSIVAQWREARAELRVLEEAEHPDITDRFGRVWTWWKGDLYRHCGCAIPERWVAEWGRPMLALLDNPNYHLCEICMRLAHERAAEGA